jgi:hypothetical protein
MGNVDKSHDIEDSVQSELNTECERIRQLAGRMTRQGLPVLLDLVDRAMGAADCPSCARSQADGVPCASPSATCDRCVEALVWVRQIRQRLEQAERDKRVPAAEAWDI